MRFSKRAQAKNSTECIHISLFLRITASTKCQTQGQALCAMRNNLRCQQSKLLTPATATALAGILPV
jgi:hypothetical protein